MSRQKSEPDLLKALHELQQQDQLQRKIIEESPLEPRLVLLRSWQSQRLAATYADLLNIPQYRPACGFFLDEIYAPRDFSQRDHDVERLYEALSHIFPAIMLRSLADTIYLTQMTSNLDWVLLHVLVDELGVVDTISPEQYAEGYRRCNNYDLRMQQIDLIIRLLEEVGKGAHVPITGLTLKLIRLPARRLGWADFYDFLERGYQALHSMKHVEKLTKTIEQREKRILDQIYAGKDDPFNTND